MFSASSEPAEWVTAYVTAAGLFSFALTSDSGTPLGFASREAGANAPQLIIETDTSLGGMAEPVGMMAAAGETAVGTQTTVIMYDYDPLGRLREANYTGIFSGTYAYSYDALSNRLTYSTNITTTETMTHTYDAANRLLQSIDQDGLLTTYDWDAAGRLLTTTVDNQVSRVYSYNQRGHLLQADVDGLLTSFSYDGDGNRLLMSVAGEVTTYTLDYARRGQRILLETGPAGSKHYLYGLECIAELVDTGDAETEEWRYYQRDGRGMVRQTTNLNATVTLAWAYSPDGAVVLGEKGPVTYLDCGSGAVYDWSTGLVFKNGNYFDPRLGLWLMLPALLIWPPWIYKRKRSKRGKHLLICLCLLMSSLTLVSCGDGDLHWEDIGEEIICSPNKPDDLNPTVRGSEKVNIEHVSGPSPTVFGGHNWRVKFVLEKPAKRDGYIIQEINRSYNLWLPGEDQATVPPYTEIDAYNDGANKDRHFFEAWPVKKGNKEATKFIRQYDDEYFFEDRDFVGNYKVVGVVKFYEGDLPNHFGKENVPTAGILESSYSAPQYWDYKGTAHNFYIEWDGKTTSGYARRGDLKYTWDIK